MSLWDVSQNKVVAANAGDYLARNLGFALQKGRDAKSIDALTNPKQFIAEREKQIETLLKNNVEPFFEARLKELYELGLSDDRAKLLALQQAQSMYDQQLEILELSCPNAYAQAFGTSHLARDVTAASFNIANVQKDAVREYKQRKRSGKSKK